MTSAPSLHCTDIGTDLPEDTPQVIFLHGLMGQGKNFTAPAKALLPRLHSVLVDLPDHGRSEWTQAVDYEVYAAAVADFLASGPAQHRPVHVVGHSMGGKVAMVLALRHPQLIDRLVVVDISPTGEADTSNFPHLLDSLISLDLSSLTRRSDAEQSLQPLIPDPAVRAFLLQNLRHQDGMWRWQPNLCTLGRNLSQIGGFPDLTGMTFDHPVLWIAGSDSSHVKEEHVEAMRRLFPRTNRVTIRGAGHWVHTDQPDAFVSALRTFLIGTDPA